MPRCLSAATSSLAGDVRWDMMHSICTPRRKLFARPFDRISLGLIFGPKTPPTEPPRPSATEAVRTPRPLQSWLRPNCLPKTSHQTTRNAALSHFGRAHLSSTTWRAPLSHTPLSSRCYVTDIKPSRSIGLGLDSERP